MRHLTVAHAGCDDATVQKLVLVAALFREHGLAIEIVPWQDSHTDIVVTDPADPFGQQITTLAARQGIPALIVRLAEEDEADHSFVVGRKCPAFDYFLALERVILATAVPRHPGMGGGIRNAVHSHSIVAGGFDEMS
ncbi:hypothetical protein [Isoalcanivorax indicus]|uniref:hypothetical protein n=1 Tax=Isoalcanivorax indicus TaxID=2202653 RepID=UPI000DB969B9|nr:hypothetical protein [Isoalcanivorax indicus]